MVEMYDETSPNTQKIPFMVELNVRLLLSIGVWGAIVGAGVMGLQFLIKQFFVTPVLCGSADAFALCSNGGNLALNIATVLVGVVGTIGLVRLATYRPLLIALASAATLWGAAGWLGSLAWYEMLAWLIGLYAVSYTAYAWLFRIYNFVIAFILAVVLVLAARIILIL